MVISDEQNGTEKKKLCSSISFISNGKNYFGSVFESGEKVEKRIYQKDRLGEYKIVINEDLKKASMNDISEHGILEVLIKVAGAATRSFYKKPGLKFYLRKLTLSKAYHNIKGKNVTVMQRKDYKQLFFEYSINVDDRHFGVISGIIRK